jgi:hypothetical protein
LSCVAPIATAQPQSLQQLLATSGSPFIPFVLFLSFYSCLFSGEELCSEAATSACAKNFIVFLAEGLLLTFVSPLDLLAHGWPVVGDNGVICQTMPDTHYRPTFKAVREVLHSLRSKTNTTSVVGTWSSSASCFGWLTAATPCDTVFARTNTFFTLLTRSSRCGWWLDLSAVRLCRSTGRLRL